MTKVRLTGFSLPAGFGVQWEFTESDKDIARRAIIFLEDRRVLFGAGHRREDEMYCVHSAIEIRHRLTDLIASASSGGGVDLCLREIRAACTQFVSKAGPEARNFRSDPGTFGKALGELSSLVGIQVARLVDKYGFEVEEGLLSIFPPSDQELSWVPGFDADR